MVDDGGCTALYGPWIPRNQYTSWVSFNINWCAPAARDACAVENWHCALLLDILQGVEHRSHRFQSFQGLVEDWTVDTVVSSACPFFGGLRDDRYARDREEMALDFDSNGRQQNDRQRPFLNSTGKRPLSSLLSPLSLRISYFLTLKQLQL